MKLTITNANEIPVYETENIGLISKAIEAMNNGKEQMAMGMVNRAAMTNTDKNKAKEGEGNG